MLKHEEEINEVYKKEKPKNIDVDLNAIIMEKREAKINQKKIDLIVKSEKEKWALLKKHQEEKKLRVNRGKYDKFLVQEPNQMRILFLGESCSGKTCLINRYIKDEFNPEYITTPSIQAFKSELLFYEDTSYRIELIDTPPLENFYKLLDDVIYFVQGVILVFDASNKNSFLRMQNYFKMINFYEFQKIGIIASKKDVCTENDKYKYYQLQKFCKQYNALSAFISSKNGKEEIENFLNLLCPEIIPSLRNKKEDLKLMYPYTKSIKNDFPKKNIIDEAIIKKAKEDDSSYESENSKDKKKDKEEEIKEFLKRKKLPERKKQKQKINYIYNIGNNINKKYQEDNDSFNYEEKKEEFKNFDYIIGNVNLDLEKLFEKYRPDSPSSLNMKNKKSKYNKKNKTIDVDRDWVNVNIDSLIQEFLDTRKGFKKDKKDKKSKKDEKSKKSDKNTIKSEKKEKSEKSKNSKKSKKEEEKVENEESIKDKKKKVLVIKKKRMKRKKVKRKKLKKIKVKKIKMKVKKLKIKVKKKMKNILKMKMKMTNMKIYMEIFMIFNKMHLMRQ